MPYITKIERNALDNLKYAPISPGELNYKLTQLVNDYLAHNDTNYQSFNDIIGALECAKLELYRRLIAGYEDKKIAENGDVYE